jgi:hypothetical protein
MKQDDYFESHLTTFEASNVLEAADAVVEIGTSQKPNHHDQEQFVQLYGTLRIQLLPKYK